MVAAMHSLNLFREGRHSRVPLAGPSRDRSTFPAANPRRQLGQ